MSRQNPSPSHGEDSWPKTVEDFGRSLLSIDQTNSAQILRSHCECRWNTRVDGSEFDDADDLFTRTVERLVNSQSEQTLQTESEGVRYGKTVINNLLKDDARKIIRHRKKQRNLAEQVPRSKPACEPRILISERRIAFQRLLRSALVVLSPVQYSELYSRALDVLSIELVEELFPEPPRCPVAQKDCTRRKNAQRAREQLQKFFEAQMAAVGDFYDLVFQKRSK